MKPFSTIILVVFVAASALGLLRYQELRELRSKHVTFENQVQQESTSFRRTRTSEQDRTRLFLEFLDRKGAGKSSEQDLAILLGKLPDISDGGLQNLIETIATHSHSDATLRDKVISTVLKLLASRDPEATLALVLELRKNDTLNLPQINLAADFAIRQLALSDPRAAARWFIAHADDRDPHRTRKVIFASAAKLNPSLAFNLVSEFKFPGRNGSYYPYSAIGSGLHLKSINQMMPTIRNLDPSNSLVVLRAIGSGDFISDYEASVEWLEDSALTAKEKEWLLSGVRPFYVQKDFGKWLDLAASYAAKNTEEYANLRGSIGQSVYDWGGSDFVAAGEWLKRQEDGPVRSEAVSRYIEVILNDEPAIAAEWAATLPESEKRMGLLRHIHSSMKWKDSKAANELAEKYDLVVRP